MARRRIRLLGDPDLRAKSLPVKDPRSPAARLVIDDLRDTLKWAKRKYGMGRALSAPQIGAPVRIVYVEQPKKRWAMINPEVVNVGSQDFLVWDDCFSFPTLRVRVIRSYEVTLRYLDLRGRPHEIELDGPMAELLQHEMDHLDGILSVDRASGPDAFALATEWAKRHTDDDRYSPPTERGV